MSLESEVQKPWYSRLASKVIAPLAFGLASIFGCASNYRVPQTQPEYSQSQPSVEPQYESYAVDSGISSAVIAALMKFDADAPVKDLASFIRAIEKSYYGLPDWVLFDGFDGFDDTFNYDVIIENPKYGELDFEFYNWFDYSPVVESPDSELIVGDDSILVSGEVRFESAQLRDYFISKVSKIPVAFAYLLDSVSKYANADGIFQSSEVESLLAVLFESAKSGRMKSGRGFIVPKGVEDYDSFKIRVWNAYISAEYYVECSKDDSQRLKMAFITGGFDGYPESYASYVLYAHRLDEEDGEINEHIRGDSKTLRLAELLNGFDGKTGNNYSPSKEHIEQFSSWPWYTPTVKFVFTSEVERDKFVNNAYDLDPGVVISEAVSCSGLDGVLQEDEARDLNFILDYKNTSDELGTGAAPIDLIPEDD